MQPSEWTTSSLPVSVRSADLESSAERAALAGVLSEYAAALGTTLAMPAESVVDRLREDGRALVWLAWDGDRPCGMAVCFRLFSTFSGRPFLNIHDLAVTSACRGRGVGTQLLAAIAQAAAAIGASKLTLEVREDNPAAERLYRRCGFGDPDGVPTKFLSRSV